MFFRLVFNICDDETGRLEFAYFIVGVVTATSLFSGVTDMIGIIMATFVDDTGKAETEFLNLVGYMLYANTNTMPRPIPELRLRTKTV